VPASKFQPETGKVPLPKALWRQHEFSLWLPVSSGIDGTGISALIFRAASPTPNRLRWRHFVFSVASGWFSGNSAFLQSRLTSSRGRLRQLETVANGAARAEWRQGSFFRRFAAAEK
jgi:hypothetical protein